MENSSFLEPRNTKSMFFRRQLMRLLNHGLTKSNVGLSRASMAQSVGFRVILSWFNKTFLIFHVSLHWYHYPVLSLHHIHYILRAWQERIKIVTLSLYHRGRSTGLSKCWFAYFRYLKISNLAPNILINFIVKERHKNHGKWETFRNGGEMTQC